MKIWCYAKANTMSDHCFNDDVALCVAETKTEAIEKFLNMYSIESLAGNIKEVHFNSYGVYVATDY